MRDGWEVKKLGDVCVYFNGRAHENCICDDGKYIVINSKFISTDGLIFKKTNNDLFPLLQGDIVMVLSDVPNGKALAKCYLVEEADKYTLNQRICIIRSEVFNNKFLYYQLNRNRYFLNFDNGENQTNLRLNQILSCPLKIPSLQEQQQIVAILDEAFAVISSAKENAEKNLKNAKELFESYLQGVFANSGDGWEEKKLGDISKVINGYSFNSKDFLSTNQIKSVKITNVGVKTFIEELDNYLPEEYKESYKEYRVQEGNIVIALTRTIISAGLKVAIVPQNYGGALLNQRVAALVPNEKLINGQFLYSFLCTETVVKYVKSNVNTLMQPNLSINDLKNLHITFPSLSEQIVIVEKLNKLSEETKKLETIYHQKLADLEELKKSILKKAFNGELTGGQL
ncbi:MAG: hypothetical protein A2Y24_04170 [Clostridiales bacterium GWE2_32_10]|nr:MAG: hypothetical protein A2Y24_04170 [Clostridiales bacterium GWE2_32_10]HBY20146.1 restriction endonuclease subunit S [Clostridiales bacterium]